jgi:hypothetical protein
LMNVFDVVDHVDLSYSRATDVTLESMTVLAGLEDVWFDNTQVADAGLEPLFSREDRLSLLVERPNTLAVIFASVNTLP